MENKKILIADDEADIREFVKYNLVKEGFVVHTAKMEQKQLKKQKKYFPI